MKFDDFANIMAMYPTTPTRKISEEFGVSTVMIKNLANGMGIYKKGRRHKHNIRKVLVVYNAVTGEVCYQSRNTYIPIYSKKPIKLRARI